MIIKKVLRATIHNLREIEQARFRLYTLVAEYIDSELCDEAIRYEILSLKETKKKAKMGDFYNVFLEVKLVKLGEWPPYEEN